VHLIVDVVALVAMIGAVVVTWYAISYAVLLLVGKLFPLIDRRR
jgi:hypothetical protein